MKKIEIDINYPKNKDIELVVGELKKGSVMAYPTDTIYGLGCLSSRPVAIKKIRKIKERDSEKPMLLLVSSLSMVRKYFYLSRGQQAYLKNKWPGKLSVILRKKSDFSKELLGSASDPAVRLPNNPFLVKMIKKAAEPIVSTSLNISGRQPLENLKGIESYFRSSKPDLAVSINKDLKGKPSKLIDLRDFPRIKIIRK